MALTIHNAILHILNNTGGDSHFSREELDIDSETCQEFIAKHVRKLLHNPAAREATFSADSAVYEALQSFQKGQIYFKELSVAICTRLAGIMEQNTDIPPADVLVTLFDSGADRYLAILKLNCGECFTHRVQSDDSGSENQIVKNTAVLPFGSGRVEEACLIPYEPMILRILEKPYEVAGEVINYFSQLFLQCTTELSKKEAVEIISQVTEEINLKYFDDNMEMAAMVKNTLMEEAQAEGGICMENVAKKIFPQPEQETIKAEFLSLAKDSGLPYEVELSETIVKQQFKMQRFKADNGIEIKCPSALFQDPETIQVVTNHDGTISITMKNLKRQ